MPYQNNNNRLTPEAQGFTAITPYAQVTDQQIKTTPQMQEAIRFKNTADTLANLGKGLIDFDNIMQKNVDDVAIEEALNQQKLEGKEIEAWSEAQKRFPFLAKYNKNYKKAYNSRVAQEITTKAAMDLGKLIEPEKLNSEEFNKILLDNRQQMTSQLKALGLQPKDVELALRNYQGNIDKMMLNYIDKHAQYEFDISLATEARSYGKAFQNFAAGKNKDQYTIASQLLSEYSEKFKGMPKDTLVKKFIIPSILNIVKYSDYEFGLNVDEEALIRAINDYKFEDGTDIKTFDPTIENEVKTSLRTLHRQLASDREFERQEKEQAEKDNIKELSSQLFSKIYNSMEEMIKAAQELTNEAGHPEYFRSLVHEIAAYNRDVKAIDDDKEDNQAFEYECFTRRANGTLTREFIWENKDLLSKQSFVKWMNLITNDELSDKMKSSAEEKQDKANWKVYHKEALAWAKQYKTDLAAFTTEDNGLEVNYKQVYENALGRINMSYSKGEYTYEQAEQAVRDLQDRIEIELSDKKQQKNAKKLPKQANVMVLRAKNYRKQLARLDDDIIKKGTDNEISEVFTAWGIGGNNTVKVGVSRGMSSKTQAHPSLGYKEYHQAYDLMFKGGTALYMPKQTGGKLVDMWSSPTTGLVAIIQMDNGSYMMCMHLNKAFASKLKIGQSFRGSQQFAVVGYRGKDYNANIVSGEHLDIQFFNSGLNKRLTAKQFYNGLYTSSVFKPKAATDNRDKR